MNNNRGKVTMVSSIDRTPVILAMRDVGFPCILPSRRFPDEAQAILRRTDHFDLEGG